MARKTTELTQAQVIADLKRKLAKSEEDVATAQAETEAAKVKSSGRAEQAIAFIKANPLFTVESLTKALGIEAKNVSSVLNAVKKRQYRWVKDSHTFIYIGKMSDEAWAKKVEGLVVRESMAKEA